MTVLEHISDEMKQMLIESLNKRYDKINRKLQDDFAKIWYEEWQILDMKNELKRIDEIIKNLNKE